MNLQIRIATEADIPAITEIYNQAIALKSATADISPVSIESRLAWLGEYPADSYPVFVAEDQSAAESGNPGANPGAGAVGYCSLSPYRPGRMALRHTAEISYYIHEDFRGQGLGSALMVHAIAQCPALGFRSLFAILLDINTNSTRILEKFGFEQWGHMPAVADFDGTEVGHLYYGLRVAAP